MREKRKENVKVVILGSGPAGLSAAVYSARAGLEPVVICGPALGGQAALTMEIENYPGFPESISGPELIERMQRQAERFGAKILYDTAERVDFQSHPFQIETDGAVFMAENVIIATGSAHILMNVPGEKELTGRGVSYCATCDGWFYKGKNIAVVGGGNSAVEEAVFLTRFADSVTLIHRRDALRADLIVQQKAFTNPKIKFIWDSVAEEVIGTQKVEALRLRNVKTAQLCNLPIDGVFVAIGARTMTELYAGQLEIVDGVFCVNQKMETSIAGVYAAGEAADPLYRQVVTSAASGVMAAMSLIKKLI